MRWSDRDTGYVEVPGGPRCGNCVYLEGGRCQLPEVDKRVSPDNGCCQWWSNGSRQPGIEKAPSQRSRITRLTHTRDTA